MLVAGRQPGEHGRRVRSVGLGRPDRVVAEPLGLLDDPQLVGRAHPEPPVADVDSELHMQGSFRAKEIACGRPTGAVRLATGPRGPPNPMRTRRRATITDLRRAIDGLPRRHPGGDARGDPQQRHHRRRLHRPRRRICPMLAAHRHGGKTSLIAFAKAWDLFALGGARDRAARRATRRELLVLNAHLEASLLEEDAGARPGRGDRRAPGVCASAAATWSRARPARARVGTSPDGGGRPRCHLALTADDRDHRRPPRGRDHQARPRSCSRASPSSTWPATTPTSPRR